MKYTECRAQGSENCLQYPACHCGAGVPGDVAVLEKGYNGQKFDAGKTNPLLLEEDLADALAVVTRTMDYGIEKYGKRKGWKEVPDLEPRYLAAASRHKNLRQRAGSVLDRDAETDIVHIAHEIVNLLFVLQTTIEKNPAIDFLTYKSPPKRA